MENWKHIDYWYILNGIEEAHTRQREYRKHNLCRLLACSEWNIGSKSK